MGLKAWRNFEGAHSRSCQSDAGSWQKTLLPFHISLPIGFAWVPPWWHGSAPLDGRPRRQPRWRLQCLWCPSLGVTQHHFHSILLITAFSPYFCGVTLLYSIQDSQEQCDHLHPSRHKEEKRSYREEFWARPEVLCSLFFAKQEHGGDWGM